MIRSDYHLHSSFSSDSDTPMEQMVARAIELGLTRLCFTDHMDYDYPVMTEGYDFVFDINDYVKKLDELKEQYQSQIEILTGIELGLQPQIKGKLDSLVQSYPFDFIIGSSHVVDHIDPYYPVYWEGRTEEEGIERYFETIIKNCRLFDGFHVIGHIDYIVRYAPSKGLETATFKAYSYANYADLIDEVLKAILSHGKGIEVNTSGLKYGLGYTHPRAEVIKRYRELGGELITIGSDAHRPEHLCFDFDYAEELLKALGFHYYAVFKAGKPQFVKL